MPRDGEALTDMVDPTVRADMEEQARTHGDGWLIPVQRGPNDLPGKNTPHPWRSWSQPIHLRRPLAERIACSCVRCTADKVPGAYFSLALERFWRRALAAGWRVLEVETMHQILPDPHSKAKALVALLAER